MALLGAIGGFERRSAAQLAQIKKDPHLPDSLKTECETARNHALSALSQLAEAKAMAEDKRRAKEAREQAEKEAAKIIAGANAIAEKRMAEIEAHFQAREDAVKYNEADLAARLDEFDARVSETRKKQAEKARWLEAGQAQVDRQREENDAKSAEINRLLSLVPQLREKFSELEMIVRQANG